MRINKACAWIVGALFHGVMGIKILFVTIILAPLMELLDSRRMIKKNLKRNGELLSEKCPYVIGEVDPIKCEGYKTIPDCIFNKDRGLMKWIKSKNASD